jgi:hypothetical protein
MEMIVNSVSVERYIKLYIEEEKHGLKAEAVNLKDISNITKIVNTQEPL